jgi:type II secretory pathway pseudopilin PulG
MRRLITPRPTEQPDAGIALPAVIGSMAVVTVFLTTALGLALGNMPPARADQDAKAAVAAAQAGVDEYVSRLNATSGSYWTVGNDDPGNPAFTAEGTTVPGAGPTAASFSYRLLTTPAQTAQEGYITLEATGTASAGDGGREVSRTLVARLQPRGFLRFIYFTDIEAIDPELYAYYGVRASRNGSWSHSSGRYIYFATPAKVLELCSRRYYEGRDAPAYTSGSDASYYEYDTVEKKLYTRTDTATIAFGCREIQWAGGDVVDGPLHSNDALQIQGPVRFADPVVESSWADGDPARLWWGSGTPVGPDADPPGYLPSYADALSLPAGNQSMLKHVRPKIDEDPNTDRPGCLYRGATRIRFSSGQMKVWSPNTTATDTPPECLDVSNAANEQTKPIPPVIYVAPATGSCTGVGYPRTGERTDLGITTDYSPCRGTAFVEGEVDGQVTVSAEDDVVVTSALTIQDGGTETDIVGLVAGNNVWVYHPVTWVDSDGDNRIDSSEIKNLLPYDDAVRDIEASVLSLRHSFLVQNWNRGADLSVTEADRLRVFGAIAQKFRGPVGTGGSSGGSGYTKNYIYDPRLRVLQPPYFLSPDNAPWQATRVSDGVSGG